MNKSKKIFILIYVFILLSIINISAKSRKNDEKRFQMGFGFTASSASVFNFIQSTKMFIDKEYSGLTSDGTEMNLSSATKQALFLSNMLASMQLGFRMRMIAYSFFSELDLLAEPLVNVFSGKCDFLVMYDIGIRAPKWIMPYICVGVNMTFSLYPDNIEKIDTWRTKMDNVTDYFMWSFGANAKAGIDVKFKRFSVGFYCMYLIKDVINDFTDTLTNYYQNLSMAEENPEVIGTALFVASQFRLGASFCWYAF